eukprot:281165_1
MNYNELHELHQAQNMQQNMQQNMPQFVHPNQANPYIQESSGNNNDISTLMSHIHTLHNKLQIMDQNINNLKKQHEIEVQQIYQSMSTEIKSLTNAIIVNQQKNDKIINKLQEKINILTQQQINKPIIKPIEEKQKQKQNQ